MVKKRTRNNYKNGLQTSQIIINTKTLLLKRTKAFLCYPHPLYGHSRVVCNIEQQDTQDEELDKKKNFFES